MRKYTHLTLEEREKMFAWMEMGFSFREISELLGRNHTTLSRERKRNTRYGKAYVPCLAQRRYERISEKQRYLAPLKGPEVFLFARERLRLGWSPEIIAGRLGYETRGRLTITAECIYQYVYSNKARGYKLWQYLPCGRKKRMKRLGRKVRNNGKAPNAISISKRAKYIDKRRQVGHWETDNMEGSKTSKPALSVTLERAIRYVVLAKVNDQTKVEKTRVLVERMDPLPPVLRRTMTMDNGKENYGHGEVSDQLGIKTYFCHAYTSFEKGSVERRIKDIRRFIPKGTSLTRVSKERIKQVEEWSNNKPMKCLSFMTPNEKMQQLVSKLN